MILIFSVVFLIISNIFFILDGKMARKRPSIKKSNPIAVISSFTRCDIYLLMFGFIDLPKNLKNSLSGDNTSEVSPPIKAFS